MVERIRNPLSQPLPNPGPTDPFSREEPPAVHYLVIEHFRHGDPIPIYQRFRARGRLMPEGLTYVTSWITEDLTRCYQVMEAPERSLLEQWMGEWSDLMAFEVMPVLSSAEVQRRLAPRLAQAPEPK